MTIIHDHQDNPSPHDQSSDTEEGRWDKAIDRILNSGLLFPYMADFWSYVDGEIEWDQFRDRMSP